jgi:hypothetical protein
MSVIDLEERKREKIMSEFRERAREEMMRDPFAVITRLAEDSAFFSGCLNRMVGVVDDPLASNEYKLTKVASILVSYLQRENSTWQPRS